VNIQKLLISPTSHARVATAVITMLVDFNASKLLYLHEQNTTLVANRICLDIRHSVAS